MKPRLYDLALRPMEVLGLARLRARLFSPARGRVLEIGAGTGFNLRHYTGGVFLVATDVDAPKLRRARQRVAALPGREAPRAAWVLADGASLPFRDRAFDSAAVALALCTVPRPLAALRELRRVLRPDGRLRLVEHVRLRSRPLARLQDLATPLWTRLAEGCHLNRDTLAFVREAGFEVESQRDHLGGLVVEVVAEP